jgi:hypothetical protein
MDQTMIEEMMPAPKASRLGMNLRMPANKCPCWRAEKKASRNASTGPESGKQMAIKAAAR